MTKGLILFYTLVFYICFIYILLGNEILFILNRFSYERQEEIKKENDKKYSALRQVLHNFFLRDYIFKDSFFIFK